MTASKTQTLVQVSNLKKVFSGRNETGSKANPVRAVDGVSFHIAPGETLGLVGESGCGKSTVGRLVLRLIDATSGEVQFQGKSLLERSQAEMRSLRQHMQIIFQDPFASLNPRHTVGQILQEPFAIHSMGSREERKQWVGDLLRRVGLLAEHAGRYPHEFSGGQRQRIGIARAIALKPEFIVADEPVSALDVSIQAQILNLLVDLQAEMGISYLFISHDMSVIEHMCDRVAVMYLGKIVELADRDALFANPRHPYTKALLSAVPRLDRVQTGEGPTVSGAVPSASNPPSGCAFHPRCPLREASCETECPELTEVQPGHWVACPLTE